MIKKLIPKSLKGSKTAKKFYDKPDIRNTRVEKTGPTLTQSVVDEAIWLPMQILSTAVPGGPLVSLQLRKAYTQLKYDKATLKRAVEVAMRTSGGADNPMSSLSEYTLRATPSLKPIKYILTGDDEGKPENRRFANHVRMVAGSEKNGYTGFGSHITERNDEDLPGFVGAYTQGVKPTDNAIEESLENTADVYKQYTDKNYPGYNIKAYLINTDGLPVVSKEEIKKITNKRTQGTTGNMLNDIESILDTAGHMILYGELNGRLVVRELDIWDFLPKDYRELWTGTTSTKRGPLLKKIKDYIANKGLDFVNQTGNPVIVSYPWRYAKDYTSQYINHSISIHKNDSATAASREFYNPEEIERNHKILLELRGAYTDMQNSSDTIQGLSREEALKVRDRYIENQYTYLQ